MVDPRLPLPFIGRAIGVDHLASALTPIVFELACISSAIGPFECAIPVHHVLGPLTSVRFLVLPRARPLPMKLPLQKLPIIHSTILKIPDPLPMLLTILILPSILLITLDFNSLTMLQIIHKPSLVHFCLIALYRLIRERPLAL